MNKNGESCMRIKKTKDGYRLKQTINHHASYFFITLKEAINSSKLNCDILYKVYKKTHGMLATD